MLPHKRVVRFFEAKLSSLAGFVYERPKTILFAMVNLVSLLTIPLLITILLWIGYPCNDIYNTCAPSGHDNFGMHASAPPTSPSRCAAPPAPPRHLATSSLAS